MEYKMTDICADALRRYVDQGIPPGSFLTAIITNDLYGAVMRADHWNKDLIPEYVKYLHNEVPSICWGPRIALKDGFEERKKNTMLNSTTKIDRYFMAFVTLSNMYRVIKIPMSERYLVQKWRWWFPFWRYVHSPEAMLPYAPHDRQKFSSREEALAYIADMENIIS